jgi:hypothetical protein
LQEKLLARQREVDDRAANLHAESPDAARAYLTEVTAEAAHEVVEAYWNLGDLLWTKYDEKW